MPSITPGLDSITFATTYLEIKLRLSDAKFTSAKLGAFGKSIETTSETPFAAYRTKASVEAHKKASEIADWLPLTAAKFVRDGGESTIGTLILSDSDKITVDVSCRAYESYVRFTVHSVKNPGAADLVDIWLGWISLDGYKDPEDPNAPYADLNGVVIRTRQIDFNIPFPEPAESGDGGMAVGLVALHPTMRIRFVSELSPCASYQPKPAILKPDANLSKQLAGTLTKHSLDSELISLFNLLNDETKLDLAILACPANEWLSEVEKIEKAHSLPHPCIVDMWSKLLPYNDDSDKTEPNRKANAPYLFLGADSRLLGADSRLLTSSKEDLKDALVKGIDYATRGGFRYALLNHQIWLTKEHNVTPDITTVTTAFAESKTGVRLGLHVLVAQAGYDGEDSLPTVISLANAVTTHRKDLSSVDFWFLDSLDSSFELNDSVSDWTYGDVARLGEYYRQVLCKAGEDRPSEALLEGASYNNYLWHTFSRYVADDQAFIAVKQYMAKHKLKFLYEQDYVCGFIPLELGWIGINAKLGNDYEDSYASTTVDEIEYQLNQALGHNMPISIETSLDVLDRNGFSGKILDLAKLYEEMRVTQCYPAGTRSLVNVFSKLRNPVAYLEQHYPKFKDVLSKDASYTFQFQLDMEDGDYGFRETVYKEMYAHPGMPIPLSFTMPFASSRPLSIKVIPVPTCVPYLHSRDVLISSEKVYHMLSAVPSLVKWEKCGLLKSSEPEICVSSAKVEVSKPLYDGDIVGFTVTNNDQNNGWLRVTLPPIIEEPKAKRPRAKLPTTNPEYTTIGMEKGFEGLPMDTVPVSGAIGNMQVRRAIGKVIAGYIRVTASSPGASDSITTTIQLHGNDTATAKEGIRNYPVPPAAEGGNAIGWAPGWKRSYRVSTLFSGVSDREGEEDGLRAGVLEYPPLQYFEVAIPTMAVSASAYSPGELYDNRKLSVREFPFKHVDKCSLIIEGIPPGTSVNVELADVKSLPYKHLPFNIEDMKLTIKDKKKNTLIAIKPGWVFENQKSKDEYLQEYLVADGKVWGKYDANNNVPNKDIHWDLVGSKVPAVMLDANQEVTIEYKAMEIPKVEYDATDEPKFGTPHDTFRAVIIVKMEGEAILDRPDLILTTPYKQFQALTRRTKH